MFVEPNCPTWGLLAPLFRLAARRSALSAVWGPWTCPRAGAVGMVGEVLAPLRGAAARAGLRARPLRGTG
eukprot:14384257-Alexandrium_andersonii.AAC.1